MNAILLMNNYESMNYTRLDRQVVHNSQQNSLKIYIRDVLSMDRDLQDNAFQVSVDR